MKIILIGHKAQHGKDTFAAMLQEHLEARKQNCLIIHFADALKFICSKYGGWNGEKNEFGRTLLQSVGNDVREKDEHFWTDFVARYIKTRSNIEDFILIPDWRHKEEHERMMEFFDPKDIITVKISRYENGEPYVCKEMTEEQRNHKSEVDLDGYNFEYLILNVDLAILKEAAALFAEQLIASKEDYEP